MKFPKCFGWYFSCIIDEICADKYYISIIQESAVVDHTTYLDSVFSDFQRKMKVNE